MADHPNGQLLQSNTPFIADHPSAITIALTWRELFHLTNQDKANAGSNHCIGGTRTDGTRSNPKNNHVGIDVPQYGALIYDNIWLIPEVINVGNVFRDVVFQFYIYSSYRTTVTIPEISHTDLDGITFDPNILEFTSFIPCYEFQVNINVANEGPSVIDEYVYITNAITNRDTNILTIQIVGNRAILIGAEPNWENPVIERLEWKTEIDTTYDGQEIRRALRQVPRRYLEYTSRLTKHQLQAIENLIYTFFEYVFVIPVWTNIAHTLNPVYETDIEVTIDNTPIIDNLTNFVLWESFNRYTICEAIAIEGNKLTLRNVVGTEYNANTKVLPLLTGRIMENIAMSSYTSQARDLHFKFLFDQKDYLPKAPPPVTFNGVELLPQQPNWRDSLSGSWASEQEVLDDNYGRVAVISHGKANKSRSFTWLLKSYNEIRAFYQLLDRLRGRQKRIYIATYNDDFFLASSYIVGQSQILVQANNFEIMGLDDDHEYLMFRFVSRDYIIKKIIAYSELPNNVVRLNLEDAFSFSFTELDLFGIHWVKRYRMENDSIELAWASTGIVEVDTPFVERKI
jgi:hypothetical protein